ncbi:hypothetical protein EJ08DRAFT_604137 [Tothia fuscella]|uniref:F-box domain-containing protein n=1 Tax=Tothia fuscella TaxID=1048955 RepID=A0A9P4U4D3_9PEZI|nr:hypothetical protein EJ08DRAFT_604137 [Tothia fuscella]
MDNLPSELLLHILSFLTPKELIPIQILSSKFLRLARDATLWREKCFQESYQEKRRLRQLRLAASDARYEPLLQAMMNMTGPSAPATELDTRTAILGEGDENQKENEKGKERLRALANWEPGFPGERINYYEEYIQRNADISVSWFEGVKDGVGGEEKETRDVTGVGLIYGQDGSVAEKVVGALDDGSVGIWEIENGDRQGRLISRTPSCFLTGLGANKDREQAISESKAFMTETGAVECVSMDSKSKKGYFGVIDMVVEVDLETLQVISRERYPAPVTALSEARHPTPITVGTNLTLHLHDPRQQVFQSVNPDSAVRLELIGGSPEYSTTRGRFRSLNYVSLSQPGPLSIVHVPEDQEQDGTGSIWVAGRFTSLLNYDRRFFPKLRGTVHSGARISCLRSIPHSFTPREMGFPSSNPLSISAIQTAKALPGHTLLAAGEYKGKGSLELYGLPSQLTRIVPATHPSRAMLQNTAFQNRQTASSSKLLSVTSHGGKIVYSDGDGNVKWVERDGFSPIRSWNINPPTVSTYTEQTFMGIPAAPPDDIVQLLLPTMPKSTESGYVGVGEDNLVAWTGDGRVGLLGFGREKWELQDLEEEALEYDERSRRREEREYGAMMGRALRRQADELNFVRGFGLG